MDDKMGYFLGLGASKSQINLIWMEFIEIILIYIYLDYFSYSIYQEENTIRSLTDKKDKINYFNLYFNNETRAISEKLTPQEYDGHVKCMKYNFNVDLTEVFKGFLDFHNFMMTGRLPHLKEEEKKEEDKLKTIKEEPEKIEEKEEEEGKEEEKKEEEQSDENNSINLIKTGEENEDNKKKENEEITTSISIKADDEGMKEKEKKEENISPLAKRMFLKKKEQKTEESSLLKNLTSLKTKKTAKKSLFEEAKNKTKDNKHKCYNLFKDL